jgi:glycogen synthase
LSILLVTFEFPPEMATGGIGSYMNHLAHLLSDKGHKVTVFSATYEGDEITYYKRSHCENYLIPAANNEIFRIKANELFKQLHFQRHSFDVVESPEVGACALEIKKSFPLLPLVVKLHTPGVLITKVTRYYQPMFQKLRFVAGSILKGRPNMGYWAKKDINKHNDVEYEICQLADIIISPSKALRNWVSTYWDIIPSKISIVNNPFFLKGSLFEFDIPNRPKVISFVGKLSILKGMVAFTKAIPLIFRKHPDFKIYLVGRDEMEGGKSMREYMESQLSKYSDRIVFTDVLNSGELRELYKISRVCVFPSLWENYPTVILEAMAAGAAVAASDTGGIPEMINDQKTGILFDPLRPIAIANAVNFLLENDKVRVDIASKARNVLQEQLQNNEFEQKVLGVYSAFQCNVGAH